MYLKDVKLHISWIQHILPYLRISGHRSALISLDCVISNIGHALETRLKTSRDRVDVLLDAASIVMVVNTAGICEAVISTEESS
jgi:hypothetical protein